jgi:ABC-type transport system involved in multi-copper enzyme maturation permease subunit
MLTGDIDPNSINPINQLQLTNITLILLVLPILVAVITPIIFLRDTTANMTELINCTPISHNKRWLLRYVTAIWIFFLIFFLSYLAVLSAYSAEFGFTTNLMNASIFTFLFLVIPSVFLVTALALWLSSYWQSAMVLYVCLALTGIGYLILASMTGSPVLAGSSVINESFHTVMVWLDPYAITTLLNGISLDNSYFSIELITNRLFYLILSIALVYLVLVNKISMQDREDRRRIRKESKREKGTEAKQLNYKSGYVSPFVQLTNVAIVTLLKSRITQTLLIVWPLIIFNEVLSGINYAEAQSVISANSIDALNLIAFDLLSVLGSFMVALWSWFICSRDKRYHIEELIAATPVSNKQIIWAQISALTLIILILLVLTFFGSLTAELVADSDWLLVHYLIQLSLSGLHLIMLGVIFICLYHLCRSTVIAGGIVFFILIIKFTPIMTALGMTHTLWNIADTPLQAPNNFWLYSASASVYLPYMTFWLMVCISLVLFTIHCSHRGTGLGKLSLKRLPKIVLTVMSISLIIGVYLHLSLVEQKPLTNSDKRENWSVEYEKRFSDWLYKPQPSIVFIDSKIDMYPNKGIANFKLTYKLKNQTSNSINQILIGGHGNYDFAEIKVPDAKRISFDSELHQAVYQLNTPMMSGEQRSMQAEFSYKQPTLWPHRSHQVIKPNFTYLRATPLIPTIGYQQSYQLISGPKRSHYNLATKLSNYVKAEGTNNEISMSSVVSTRHDHHVISQGQLVKRLEKDQRAFYTFKTSQPIRGVPAWLSVPFSAISQVVKGTTVNVYSPDNKISSNIQLMAMTDTLTWFEQNIAPYPGEQLNLLAAPDINRGSYSLPQIILIDHTLGFRAKPAKNAGFDQRYRRTAYETSKQWFTLFEGNGEHAGHNNQFIVQSLAKYIELVMLEQRYGREAMQALVNAEQKRYEMNQRINVELAVAIIDATQDYDLHSRAILLFAKLRPVIGDKPIISTIKSLWTKHVAFHKPINSMDFVSELKLQTKPKYHSLINELFLAGAKSISQPKNDN